MNLLMKFVAKSSALFILASSSLFLAGCNHNDDKDITVTPTEPVVYSYTVKVTNLTQAQPMSPITLMLHNEGNFWQIGSRANLALEKLAESGDNSELLNDNIILASQSASGVLPAGESEILRLDIKDNIAIKFSLVTMLVNTNDAFTGINAMDISQLAKDESISTFTVSYDAGTEKNTELITSIPGPAAGGEGFNSERDDVDFVAMHAGIVSQNDGLMQSVLIQAHRFDNPTLKVTITRVK